MSNAGVRKNGPGPKGCTLKSALTALPYLEMEPPFPAHGALSSPISGCNATSSIFQTASRYVQRVSILLFVCAIVLAGTACSGESLKRFGYAVGAQHACRSANEAHVYESAEDLQCTALQGHEDLTYDEYAAARRQALHEN